MISEDDLKKYEADAALVLSNSKAYTAQMWDAARAIKDLCESVRELRALRDSWCAAYTELRDNPQAPSN